MSCEYRKSQNFSIIGEANPITGRAEPKVIFIDGSICDTAAHSLAIHLEHDVLEAIQQKDFAKPMPTFWISGTRQSLDFHSDFHFSGYIKPHLKFHDAATPFPPRHNFNLYTTDPELLGIFENQPVPESLKYANKILVVR